jgi:hypothetical protein
VNLAFYRGVDLDDRSGTLRGTGKAMRHVRITKPEQLEDKGLQDLLVSAREERRQALCL